MSLAHALAPERVVLSFWQNRIRIHPVQREHSRIPAHGNNPYFPSFFRCSIHISKVLRDSGMGIETVYDVEQLRKLRRLLRQIRSAAAAENHHINLILPVRRLQNPAHGCRLCQYMYILRVPPGKYCRQLHVRILPNRTFHAAPKISVT